MYIYIIYFIILLIFLFLILVISKAINQGVKAKSERASKEKNFFSNKKIQINIVEEIKQLKKLRQDKILTDEEFKKAKDKLLND